MTIQSLRRRNRNGFRPQNAGVECPECCSTDVTRKEHTQDTEDPAFEIMDLTCVDCQHNWSN